MANHPNRNWRRVMGDAALLYVTRYRWPDSGVQIMRTEELRDLLLEAYQAGYTDGRKSKSTRTGNDRDPQ